jgi:hypothetical protein
MPISITVKIKTYDIISGAGEKVVSALHAWIWIMRRIYMHLNRHI